MSTTPCNNCARHQDRMARVLACGAVLVADSEAAEGIAAKRIAELTGERDSFSRSLDKSYKHEAASEKRIATLDAEVKRLMDLAKARQIEIDGLRATLECIRDGNEFNAPWSADMCRHFAREILGPSGDAGSGGQS